ncbi:MAG: family 43 glycosylhydrolase, partial [Planctomycetota bacterium]
MCKNLVYLAIFILLLALSAVTYASPQTIEPAVLWYDSSSNLISAHGGGILKQGSTYYWFGEYKDCDPNNILRAFGGHVTHQFVAHTCYSSTDFANWTFVNNVLTQQAEGDLGPGRVVERPKVIYNDSTAQYVMYMHIDNQRYGERKVGVATCSTVSGNYTYQGSFQPLGNDSKDMTLFKDDDGKAYLISGSINIYRLTDDYLDVNNLVLTMDRPKAEAPAMFK